MQLCNSTMPKVLRRSRLTSAVAPKDNLASVATFPIQLQLDSYGEEMLKLA